MQGQSFAGAIECRGPPGERLKDASVLADKALAELLAPQRHLVAQAAARAGNVVQLANAIQDLACGLALAPEKTDESRIREPRVIRARLAQLLADVDAVGWAQVVDLTLGATAANVATLQVKLADAGGREHVFSTHVSVKENLLEYTASIDAPAAVAAASAPQSSFKATVKIAAETVKGLQPLWNALDALDAAAWVLDPPLPAGRAIVHRRIAVRDAVSAIVTLDPRRPVEVPPQCQFMGPSAATAPLEQRFAATAASLWDPKKSLVDNLACVFGSSLPQRPRGDSGAPLDTTSDAHAFDCGICYAFELVERPGGPLARPDVYCVDARCARPFHRACLVEWLSSSGLNQAAFGRLSGECPYCSARISVNAPGFS